MAAALAVEATISGDDQWTAPQTFRGRVNVYVGATSPAWVGSIELQRRFPLLSGELTPWMTVATLDTPSLSTFVEHESDVEYRVGATDAPANGSPLVRLSQ